MDNIPIVLILLASCVIQFASLVTTTPLIALLVGSLLWDIMSTFIIIRV
jgi:hypothetical protein